MVTILSSDLGLEFTLRGIIKIGNDFEEVFAGEAIKNLLLIVFAGDNVTMS